MWRFLCFAAWCGPFAVDGLPEEAQSERNNWAVLVDTSRYWYNYRHVANVLSFYHTVKRLGIPDSRIILMVAEDIPCNSRNARPGTVFNQMRHDLNLYGEDVEVDYRGDEVSVENFLRLLTGRHTPSTPRSKRLLTDSMSNIFIFITGHSGDEFIKFQDWEEITSTDIADAFAQMHKQRRYRKIFWVSDTCQAATLQNQFYSPEIIAIGSSGKKENSYSHHVDQELGIAIIDRFTFYALEFLNRLTPSASHTIKNFEDWFNPRFLNSHPEMRTDLFSRSSSETLITEFLASTGRMRFLSSSLQLARSGEGINISSCAAPLQPGEKPQFQADTQQWGGLLQSLWNFLDVVWRPPASAVGFGTHERPRPGTGSAISEGWLLAASLLAFALTSGVLGLLL